MMDVEEQTTEEKVVQVSFLCAVCLAKGLFGLNQKHN